MMPVGQITRSAFRRALQTCFFEGIIVILNNSPKRGNLETRFNASWKWVLTLCALLQQGVSENSAPIEIRKNQYSWGFTTMEDFFTSTRKYSPQKV